MAEKVRLQMELARPLHNELRAMADAEGITMSELLRRGLSVLKAFQQQKAVGRNHLGFVSDRTKLDAEMIW